MPKFSVKGRDKDGKLKLSTVEAASADGAASQLMSGGFTPISVELATEIQQIEMPVLFRKKVSLEELSMFCRQMYSLTKSGVVLNRAIRGLAESVTNERLSEVLLSTEISLNSGMNLSKALSQHKDVFDDMFINIISVGENSGQLDMAFKQMNSYLELEKDTRRRIGTATRYPMFVMIAIFIAVLVLNYAVIPVFADLFSKFNAELPLATRILIGSSEFFRDNWLLVLIVSLGLVFGVRYYVNTNDGRLFWDRIKLKIPIVGSILSRATLARFCRSFALMLNSGVPLINALELSSQSVGNAYVGSNIRNMRTSIQRGESLLRSAINSKMFTPLVLQMVQVGEETGQVDEMLVEVAEFYEQEVDYDLKNLSSYIEPILISFIAGLVMLLALGIFMPMWDMMNVMKG
jgi:MSHA biogenesis protein MshG